MVLAFFAVAVARGNVSGTRTGADILDDSAECAAALASSPLSPKLSSSESSSKETSRLALGSCMPGCAVGKLKPPIALDADGAGGAGELGVKYVAGGVAEAGDIREATRVCCRSERRTEARF